MVKCFEETPQASQVQLVAQKVRLPVCCVP